MRDKMTETISVKFDKNSNYNKTRHKSGLTIVSEKAPDSASFALGFCVKAGSANDAVGFEGTAHFMEHIAFRRTRNYSGKRLVTEFESIGAYINAFTTKEFTCFYVVALNSNFKKCLKLLTEVVFYPEFNEKDILKEKNIIIEEIASYEDDPEESIFDIGEKMLFSRSRYEHPITGSTSSVSNIGLAELKGFHDKYYNLANVILSYSGPLSHDEVSENIDKISLPANFYSLENTVVKLRYKKPNRLELAKSYQQNHLLYAIRTVGMNSKDKYVYALISNALGEGLSSRLNLLLRERFGFVYTVYTALSLYKDFGTLGIYAATEEKNQNKIESLIKTELRKLSETGLKKRELSSAKEQIKSSTIIALEGVSSKMQSLAKMECSGSYYESIEDTIKLVDEVENEDIIKVIKKHLAPERWSEVIFKR